MTLNRNGETSAGAWLWRVLLGPAQIVDGAAATLTFGTLNLGIGLATARLLSKARANKMAHSLGDRGGA